MMAAPPLRVFRVPTPILKLCFSAHDERYNSRSGFPPHDQSSATCHRDQSGLVFRPCALHVSQPGFLSLSKREMVTAAVLGAAVGVGAALVLALSVLIYRYHAAQRKAINFDRSWSERDSWTPVPAAYKSANQSKMDSSQRCNKQLYLPLNLAIHKQSFTKDSVQPPLPSLAPREAGRTSAVNMSGTSGGGSSNKRSSPLTYFSLDIPTNLLGGSSGLPHQSSLPFVSRLVRTPSTNDADQQQQQQDGQQRRESIQRSPSPSCRHRLPSSPTPTTAAVTSSPHHHLTLTPYPSPMVSPTPSFSSLLSCLASSSSSCNSPIPQPVPPPTGGNNTTPAPVSPLIRNRSRSPMLAKMNSVQSSTSTNSNQSLGSTTSLCCPPPTPTPLGALQPELYKRETTIHIGLEEESISNDPASSGGSDFGSGDHTVSSSGKPPLGQRSSIGGISGRNSSAVPLGRLHFRLSYDFDKSDLLVHLIEVRDVSVVTASSNDGGYATGSTSSSGGSCSSTTGVTAVSGSNHTSGPSREAHVRLTLQPEVDQRRRQSARSIRLGVDSSCTFDEHFKFPVSHDHLVDKTLRFQICEFDRFSRPCVIGDLLFSLAERDVGSSDHPVDIWAEMMKNTLPDETRPQLLISLSYLPSAERLTVVVLKAKNLVVPANKENIDPLVKLYLMVNGKRMKKKKTDCRRGTSQPVWNQALTFTIPSAKLHSCTLEIAVVDHGSERGGKSALLGCVTLGPEGNPSTAERQHWQDMAHNVRKSIAMWHYLK